ncbi:MAG: SMC-Scp complex subunit ScpB [Candidatus Kaiserbacteria bacterium]|nr:SMC-Scp complex subunit ScpB [Candidatus Kaiserbacteria bacterium]
MDLANRIEALLFAEGGSLAKKKLAQILEVDAAALTAGLHDLAARKEGTGLSLVETHSEVTLAVSPDAASTIEKAFEKEVGREIGDAGLEVLAIILYRGPSTRAQIDYIRGVNTSTTIRTLTARGLVERIPNPEDGREYLYRPTTELLAHLGVGKLDDLPEYGKISSELATFEESKGPFAEHNEPEQPTSES